MLLRSGVLARHRSRHALEVADTRVAARSHEREDGSLRVCALKDPAVARHLNWTLKHVSAACLDALCGRIDIADIEVVEPEWDRHRCGLGEHAATGNFADG